MEKLAEEKLACEKSLKDAKSTSQMNEAMLKFQQSQLNTKITLNEKKIEEGIKSINDLKAENSSLKLEV